MTGDRQGSAIDNTRRTTACLHVSAARYWSAHLGLCGSACLCCKHCSMLHMLLEHRGIPPDGQCVPLSVLRCVLGMRTGVQTAAAAAVGPRIHHVVWTPCLHQIQGVRTHTRSRQPRMQNQGSVRLLHSGTCRRCCAAWPGCGP